MSKSTIYNEEKLNKFLRLEDKLKQAEKSEVICVNKKKLIQMLQTLEGFKRQILSEIRKA